MTDVKNAYETLLNSRDILQMYDADYLGKAQQSLDLAQSSYAHGSASMLDFLDAQRSYRSTELSYRQALASYMGRFGNAARGRGHKRAAIKRPLIFG